MKTKFFIPFLTLLMLFSTPTFAQNKKSDKKNDKETVLFDVSMHCENCKKRIEKNIAYEKGVTDMKVDLPAKTVQVEFKKDKTSVSQLQAALEKLGYDVSIHSDKPTNN